MQSRMMLAMAICLLGSVCLAEDAAAPEKAPDQEQLEKQFAEKLTGALLIGNYTLGPVTPDTKLSEDRYEIKKVSKIKGDLWLFETRIKYSQYDVTVPLPLRVLWAGDTPVITLDKVPVPGIGTFTARVLFHGNEYAGTWSGADHGGHLFGRIEKKKE